MFDDKNWIMDVVNKRDADMIVIPLYVTIYGKPISILELNKVNKRFDRSAFKIVYGTADALFMPNSFPIKRASEFDIITVFTNYDEDKDRRVRYTVFECGDVDVDEENPDALNIEIHGYYEALFNHVKNIVDDYFKALIALEDHPIIVKEEEKDEEEKVSDELLYAATDDEGNIIYETDEDDEEDDSSDSFDDYISEDEYPKVTEEGIIGKETVDFINGEGKYSDDDEDDEDVYEYYTDSYDVDEYYTGSYDKDDYSTDFDII